MIPHDAFWFFSMRINQKGVGWRDRSFRFVDILKQVFSLNLIIPCLFFIDGAFDISIVQHPSRFPLAYPENHSDVF